MALNKSYSTLQAGSVTFNEMLKSFGVVTVMNAKVYPFVGNQTVKKIAKDLGITEDAVRTALGGSNEEGAKTPEDTAVIKFEDYKANNIYDLYKAGQALCELKTLKMSNVTEEGPTKTVTGGQYTNPLIKFGKTARFEMQEALGNAMAIQAFNGVVIESFNKNTQSPITDTQDAVGPKATEKGAYVTGTTYVMHATQNFSGPKTIVGESFFIDQRTGAQVPVCLMFYQVQPDDVFNLTQDAEGDATVFDMNGDLLTTDIKIGTVENEADIVTGVFYSVLAKDGVGSAGSESEGEGAAKHSVVLEEQTDGKN